MLHQRRLNLARLFRGPELAAVIQVVADGQAGGFCGGERFRGDFRRRRAQRRRDAARVKPFRAAKHFSPIDRAGLDSADGGKRAVVVNRGGARRGAELGEIQADAVVARPLHARDVDALRPSARGDQPAERVLRQPRNPARRHSQPRGRDGDVQLAAADIQIERMRLLEPLK